jgi:hypothetical protein
MMILAIETRGVEESQYPFYTIRYAVIQDDIEIFESVARYVHTRQGGKVQFLEPDLKKLQKLPDGMEQVNKVEQVLLAEGARLVAERGGQ